MFESLKRCETCPDRLLVHNIGKTTLCLDRGPHPAYRGSPGTSYITADGGERHSERFEFWEAECSAVRSYNENIPAPEDVKVAIGNGAHAVRALFVDRILSEVVATR